MSRIAFLLLFSFLLLSLESCSDESFVRELPFYTTPDFTPHFLASKTEANKLIPHKISSFKFTNQHNEQVTDEFIEGKIHVASFIFTSCGSICPTLTNQMKRASDTFISEEDVAFLSYSVTPWIDTVERLNDFANQYKINDPNWMFLTGNKAEIYSLARTSYFAEEQMGFTKDSTEFLHTEHFILVDKEKRIRGIYNGTLALEVDQLIADIQTLKGKPH